MLLQKLPDTPPVLPVSANTNDKKDDAGTDKSSSNRKSEGQFKENDDPGARSNEAYKSTDVCEKSALVGKLGPLIG